MISFDFTASFFLALSVAAVKHEMMACRAAPRGGVVPIVHHRPPSLRFGAAAPKAFGADADTLVSQEKQKRVKALPSSRGWHFHLIPAHLTAKTSQCRPI
jgi:hypothetical protein